MNNNDRREDNMKNTSFNDDAMNNIENHIECYQLPCAVIRDILPLYAEKLVSETTQNTVKAHLDSCEECAKAFAAMDCDENEIKNAASNQNIEEIDYLKKVKKRGIMSALICAAAAVLILCGVWYVKFFMYSGAATADSLDYAVDIDNNVITFSGSAKDKSMAVSDVKFDYENGKVVISAKKQPKVFWNSSDFFSTFMVSGQFNEVWVGDSIIWERGVWIEPDVSRLYAAKTPYIGDISAIGKAALAVGVPYHYGNFTNELQTSEEPYGWTIKITEPLKTDEINIIQYNEMMKRDVALLMALIDNLGYVTFEYGFYDTTGESVKSIIYDTFTITAEQASEIFGFNVKSCADSAQQLSNVLDKIQYQ